MRLPVFRYAYESKSGFYDSLLGCFYKPQFEPSPFLQSCLPVCLILIVFLSATWTPFYVSQQVLNGISSSIDTLGSKKRYRHCCLWETYL